MHLVKMQNATVFVILFREFYLFELLYFEGPVLYTLVSTLLPFPHMGRSQA